MGGKIQTNIILFLQFKAQGVNGVINPLTNNIKSIQHTANTIVMKATTSYMHSSYNAQKHGVKVNRLESS